MAGYNEILTGRFNRALQKLLSMKGPASMNELSSILYPMWPFFNGVENRFLEGWNRYGQAFVVGAVAANNSAVRLRNGTTNIIAVVEKCLVWGTALNNITVEGFTPTTTDLAVNVSQAVTRLDARQQGLFTAMQVTQQNTAPLATLGFTHAMASAQTGTPYDFIQTDDQEWPLLPGDALQVRANSVNNVLEMTMWWRERLLEDSELKG